MSCETKDSVMRQDSEHALSVLKSNSFVLKWKRVVSVLSALSLFSRGGSHINKLFALVGRDVAEWLKRHRLIILRSVFCIKSTL